jgi:ubiquinone/menaquinone biosynthesis C-methylase UbiE
MNPLTWWDERVLPRLVDVALSDATSRRWRELVVTRASGRVLEVGFGSGRNLEHYGAGVTEVLAVEPMDLAWERASSRVESFHRAVRRVGLDGAALPVRSGSVDTVVSTWTMCTIPSLTTAIAEMHRVLRPTGTLLFVEHVASPHPRAGAIQRGVQPGWGPISGGCHLDRDIEALLEAGGFSVTPLSSRPDPRRFELVPFASGEARPTGFG